ncbi:aspartate-semialdehyde dehydrogenase [Mycoplasmatota bacterium]|nr:aspartate-semialdehyde dehydrogenase [Mycoplasmatota bacterium]
MKTYDLAIVGATGLVGQTFIKVLEERNFPINKIVFFASKRSAGKTVLFKNETYQVRELTTESFNEHFDFALFSAGAKTSLTYGPIAKDKKIVVIDNSSAFRMDAEIPLVVPEVNGYVLDKDDYLIANPNCSTIQSVVPIKVIDDLFGIKRVVYSTYQATSGAGYAGLEDLKRGQNGLEPVHFEKPIYDNCLPHIDIFLEDGYTKEEQKMIFETKKLLNKDIKVTATCVRVPITYGHSVSMNVETYRKIDLNLLIKAFNEVDGLIYHDKDYPTVQAYRHQDDIHLGRLRLDDSVENGLNLWVVADNIRKGAATNTIQIAEYMIKEGLK